MSADLLPCPFCGGAPELEDHRTIFAVRCECEAFVLGKRAPEPDGTECAAYWDDIRRTAIAAWNRRAPVQAQGVSLSEREAFEKKMREMGADDFTLRKWVAVSDAGETYRNPITQDHWQAWQARATLDQAKPVARGAASERPTAADAGGLQFCAAIDSVYPMPESPHTSVLQRAVDNRIAFRAGWERHAELCRFTSMEVGSAVAHGSERDVESLHPPTAGAAKFARGFFAMAAKHESGVDTSSTPPAQGLTDCCDTPNYCSSVRRCTAKDAGDPPSVETQQFLTDVVTAAGLLSHGKTDKGLAKRISEYAYKMRAAPPAPVLTDAKDAGYLRGDAIEVQLDGEWHPARFIATDLVGGEPLVQRDKCMPIFATWSTVRRNAAIERMTGNAGGEG